MRVNFIIKKPKSGYRTIFGLSKVVSEPGKPRVTTKITHPTLTEINKRLLNERETESSALQQVKRLRERLYSELYKDKRTEPLLSENMKVLEAYWEAEYVGRQLRDESSARADLTRAVRALGQVPLKTASANELQKKIDAIADNNKQRRTIDKLHQLLRFLGRGVKLKKRKKVRRLVRYLEHEEFLKAVAHVKDPVHQSLIKLAFYSGLRLGECFSLTKRSLVGDNVLFIGEQMYDDGTVGPPKRDKVRNAFLFPEGLDAFKAWLAVPIEERKKLRTLRWADIVATACRAVFKTDPEKWLHFHDLRHSYAIWLLDSNVHINDVALSLGDDIQTCQEHYARFINTSSHTQAILATIKRT